MEGNGAPPAAGRDASPDLPGPRWVVVLGAAAVGAPPGPGAGVGPGAVASGTAPAATPALAPAGVSAPVELRALGEPPEPAGPEPPPATFRTPLPAGCGAFLLGFAVYLAVKHSTDWPYPFAAGAGVAMLVYLVAIIRRLRDVIRVDAHGVSDVRRGFTVAWRDLRAIRFDFLEVKAGDRRVTLRVATLRSAAGGEVRFGNLEPLSAARLDGIVNLRAAPLLLALVAARTGCAQLLPVSWCTRSPDAEVGAEGGAAAAAPRAGAAPAQGEQPPRRSPLGMIAVAFKLLPKAGAVAAKLLKTIKPGAAAVSFALYSLISWKFAAVLMCMVGFHECGHVYAMWRCGVPVKGIYFLPFLGGVAVGKGIASTRGQNAYINLNGPAWGTALVALCFAGYFADRAALPWLAAAGTWGALINLFNLLPVVPLDGGHLFKDLAYSVGGLAGRLAVAAALVAGGVAGYLAGYELLVLAAFVGLYEFFDDWEAAALARALGGLDPALPLGLAEIRHLSGWVGAVASPEQALKAEERLLLKVRGARQTPLTGRQAALVLGAYLLLAAVLLATLWATRDLPGTGDPVEFLK